MQHKARELDMITVRNHAPRPWVSQALISRIHWTFSANQKREFNVSEFNVHFLQSRIPRLYTLQIHLRSQAFTEAGMRIFRVTTECDLRSQSILQCGYRATYKKTDDQNVDNW